METAGYQQYGLTRETWVALCALVLTGPLRAEVVAPEAAYATLISTGHAVKIENMSKHGLVNSIAATPEGARLFCQCLRVNTVEEGIAYLQARNLLHRASAAQ